MWSVITRSEHVCFCSRRRTLCPRFEQTLSRILLHRIYLKEVVDALHDAGEALKPHSGVDILLRKRGVVVRAPSLSNCVNTLFQNSMKRSQSHPGLQSGEWHPNSSPRSKYISEQGPQGPEPCSQKLSAFPRRTMRFDGSTPISFVHIEYASSSSVYMVAQRRFSGISRTFVMNSHAQVSASFLK